MDKRRYYFEKLKHRKTGYPIATLAFYGPDNLSASKAVVGIISSENDEPVLRKWFAEGQDLRQSESIMDEIIEHTLDSHARRLAMVDRIIGCPHEEGVDNPEGGICPQCPFWANRHHWTGEIIA